MRAWSRQRRQAGETVALVPTMGYLHEGHLSLIGGAKERADRVVASVYVNPGQFAPHEDFDSYPRDSQGDRDKLQLAGCDVVFEPPSLYGDGHQTWLRVEALEKPLCGGTRPHFFRGVATVVAKLLNIVEPDLAVFGRKDYQQWRVIQRMVEDLHFDVEIVAMPLVREDDGLAMSSRNARLNPQDRVRALTISQALMEAKRRADAGEKDAASLIARVTRTIAAAGGEVDYVEIVDANSLTGVSQIDAPAIIAAAAVFGGVRLIDNVEVAKPVHEVASA